MHLEISEKEYKTISGSFVSAIQLYDQEIELCKKVILKNGPDPMLEETVQYWELKRSETVSLSENLLYQCVKGGNK